MTRSSLVIGGTRNLGPDLVSALLQRGDRVCVLNRGQTPVQIEPRTKSQDPWGSVERLRADRSDSEAMAAVLASRVFDLVVDTTLYQAADSGALVRLMSGRCGRYLFWSTGQVYLVRTGPRPPFRETDYDGPVMAEPLAANAVDHDNWDYGIGKRGAEDVLRSAHAERGFDYVSLRMPMINSRRDHYARLAAYVRRLLDGGPIVVPDDQDRLQLRHVAGDDVIAATLKAAEPGVPSGSCLNIAQDKSLSLEAMLAIVGEALGVAPRLLPVPRAELEGRSLLPACSPWSGRWMSVLSNERSKEVLGMRYRTPREYLPELVELARAVPEALVPGYERRAEELGLAGA